MMLPAVIALNLLLTTLLIVCNDTCLGLRTEVKNVAQKRDDKQQMKK